jgi:hypothetical protein
MVIQTKTIRKQAAKIFLGSLFNPKNGGGLFFRKDGSLSIDYTA